MPEIKLASFVQQRLLDVFLKDVSLVRAIIVFFFLFKYGFNLVEGQANNDAISSVGILAGLDNPGIVLINVAIKFLFLHFFNFLTNGIKILEKLQILIILQAILDMERQGQMIKHIDPNTCIILAH